MEKINIAELLKDCPKGMELDCILFNNPVTLDEVADIDEYSCPITVTTVDGDIETFTKYGQHLNRKDAKCIIFPKGKTTWEGFVSPCKFKDGDIVSTMNGIWIGIVKKPVNYSYETYITINGESLMYDNPIFCFERFATEEEKQKLFDAIKANGYKWNPETKTLEKVIEQKFKVGDRVRLKSNPDYIYTIYCLTWDDNKKLAYKLLPKNDKHLILVSLNKQDNYELVPNKFDITTLVPFESKVLVRDRNNEEWRGQFFSHYNTCSDRPYICIGIDGLCEFKQCIPYEQNEHLLGKIDDCDEYFKNW